MRTHDARSIALMAGVLTVVAACGSSAEEARQMPPPGSPAATPSRAMGYDDLRQALAAQGAPSAESGDVRQPFLRVAGRIIVVRGEPVQVYEYADLRMLDEDAHALRDPASAVVSWVDPPTFWRMGRLIVIHVGRNDAVRAAITAALKQPPFLEVRSPAAVAAREPVKSGDRCRLDADCVAASCCHAAACASRDKAPACADVACTEDCRPATIDCGGGCACIDGVCAARLNDLPDHLGGP